MLRAADLMAANKALACAGEWPLDGEAYAQWGTLEPHLAARGK